MLLLLLQIQYLMLDVEDQIEINIAQQFERCFECIEEARAQNSAVLVHCYRGMSRSATIVIAYLMKAKV